MEASTTGHLQGKPVPQYNYKGSQRHSTITRDITTVQVQGIQCHNTREASATVQVP